MAAVAIAIKLGVDTIAMMEFAFRRDWVMTLMFAGCVAIDLATLILAAQRA